MNSSEAAKPKLSFAKVAASASSRPNQAQSPSQTVQQGSHASSAPSTRPNPTNGTHMPYAQAPHSPGSLEQAPLISRDINAEILAKGIIPPVIIQRSGVTIEKSNSSVKAQPAPVDAALEDATHSSAVSAQPASSDSKSTVSTATFALDEKESLRPDDSASVKGNEEEEPESVAWGSRFGSDTGARAFSDQLHEIAAIGPASRQLGAGPRLDPRIVVGSGTLPSPLPASDSGIPRPLISGLNSTAPQSVEPYPPDEKLLEALTNPTDRLWVLKLEQDVTDFVKDSTELAFDVPQCNSFYRMLAHRMADYYLLGHGVDSSMSSVRLYKTPNSRIPSRLTSLTNPSTAASTPPPIAPKMQILRRSGNDGSVDPRGPGTKKGADGDENSGSDGEKAKMPKTREERQARYEEARLRILGSANPTEESAVVKEKEVSRSSSAAGKKKNRKPRSNSEDGFEARSAFSTYQTPTYSSDDSGPQSGSMFYPGFADTAPTNFGSQATPYSQTSQGISYNQMPAQQGGQYGWPQSAYPGPGHQGYQTYMQDQNAYDLSGNFQQSMSMQSPGIPSPYLYNDGAQAGMRGGEPQYFPEPQRWQMQGQQPQGYPSRPLAVSRSSSGGPADGQHYAYGMLPNQMNLPSTKNFNPNHPIPGSFNRQQFNPQSQAFIPAQQMPMGPRPGMSPFMGSGPTSPASMYMPSQALQRQPSNQTHMPAYASPRPGQQDPSTLRTVHGLTHPLPQPVFPAPQQAPFQQQQMQQMQSHQSRTASPHNMGGPSMNQSSSIAKWGAPSSLPAKPPPPASESFDMSRMGQYSGNSSSGNSPLPHAPRVAGNGVPFHPLPSISGFKPGNGGMQSPAQ